jgi:hypothetical protein
MTEEKHAGNRKSRKRNMQATAMSQKRNLQATVRANRSNTMVHTIRFCVANLEED